MSSHHTTTEEHRPPSGGAAPRGRPVLVTTFPACAGLPLPEPGQVVGRAWLAGKGLRDAEVSGGHARFTRADGRVHVEDAGSRNGTWVNGVRVAERARVPLDDGAVLRLGRTLFVYRAAFIGDLAPAAPLGRLVGPWGLGEVRARVAALESHPEPNVLIEGETGTGKELVAAAVMRALGRAKPSASINVAAVASGVFEAQLFGWVKGAYSGSAAGGEGILRKNQGGSVFLDEIGELPSELQPKLLRLLENREILPVGASRPIAVDVAVVAATNRSLDDAVERGAFRRDLLARFTARIHLPPLGDRAEDRYAILAALAERRGLPLDPGRAEVEAVERLMLAPLPANVRDLDRLAATLSGAEPLTLAAVEGALGARVARGELSREDADRMVAACGGNERDAERRFGVSRGKLRRARGKAGGDGGRST